MQPRQFPCTISYKLACLAGLIRIAVACSIALLECINPARSNRPRKAFSSNSLPLVAFLLGSGVRRLDPCRVILRHDDIGSQAALHFKRQTYPGNPSLTVLWSLQHPYLCHNVLCTQALCTT
ncbi:hypothetical protein IQ06DRAFT_153467 [Phaeosphaeriaceae sp. SRC1lsM3a]|nr:hypothetical protein IQ06DRAFT_153467 [Stagonospora sp. SRC1lsM3a]